MNVIKRVDEAKGFFSKGEWGFIATMGALHRGHLALVEKARAENESVVVSIFVNPLQFNDPKDYQGYPDVFERDLELLKSMGVDAVFKPSPDEIYPDDLNFKISEGCFSEPMEGVHRPGHFLGMLTVVLKLLLILKPRKTYFGEKDYQQYLLVKKMARAFFLDTKVIPVPIVRDEFDLPLSSRHVHLSEDGLKLAREISKIFLLTDTAEEFMNFLKTKPVEIDYVEKHWGRLFTVYRVEGVRLLDNKRLEEVGHESII